ncbi:MAG: Peptidase family C69 [Promethearchaeota archaeon]|nr:MAG: Peptidase family C69 [Candidatus Lokiarchaeota archaeon]
MCDTFVSLPDASLDDFTIFGKNSDRPIDEPQLITYNPRKKHGKEEDVECTYITIPESEETYSVLLSQPFWMFGAEMGVNEHNVAIGNEAVYTKEKYREKGLLGMDLLRLGLERGKSAEDALNVITDLIEKYGQGGSNSYNSRWLYHNTFIIADSSEAYVLETADKWWIAEKVKDVRSISNNLTIRGKGDIRREGIIQHAIEKGYCRNEEEFDFALIFSDPPVPDEFPLASRQGASNKFLNNNNGNMTVEILRNYLRSHKNNICMHGQIETTGSQISHLKRGEKKSIHWFTGSNRPCESIYKPYLIPADDFRVKDPGPYTKIDSDWFWVRYRDLMKEFKNQESDLSLDKRELKFRNELDAIEKEIWDMVKTALNKEQKLEEEEFTQEIQQINSYAWKEAYEMII